ncbi:MAG TPA: hypothetical protein VH639_27310 [Bryobacteraceae bacterium]|jgi:hypothetical protein
MIDRAARASPLAGLIATAPPITFQGKTGKQYVAVVAAGGGQGTGQALVARSRCRRSGNLTLQDRPVS